jgi:hypothetical protein
MPDGTLFLTEPEILAIEDSLIDYDDPAHPASLFLDEFDTWMADGWQQPETVVIDYTATDEVPF